MDNNLITKAKNYFILGRMAEKINMLAESAVNYFKALSAVNDCMLGKFGLKPRDYVERFNMLKKNIIFFSGGCGMASIRSAVCAVHAKKELFGK